MNPPLISVIIPVYNHAAALHQSLQTLCAQTYRPLEVIIINDGSTDDFEKHIPEYKRALDAAHLETTIINQVNQGAPTARNRGILASHGEYIICWDADTLARPSMLEQLYGALLHNPAVSFSYCSFDFGFKRIKSRPFNTEFLRRANYIDTTSLVRRTDMVLFDPSLKRFQDWDVWLTMAEKGKMGIFVQQVLFKKIIRGRKGYSAWFPAFFLRLPWKTARVQEYLAARERLSFKHHLPRFS